MLMFRRVLGGLKTGSRRFFLIFIVVLISLAVIYRLESSPKAVSQNEKRYVTAASSLKAIYDVPADAPHKLMVLAANKVFHPRPFYLRSISIVFAMAISICFYILCRHWLAQPSL